MKDLAIIITMAGLSKRFTDAGFTEPKYKLKINNRTLFEYSLLGFKNYFSESKFLFIARDISNTQEFINQKCIELGIKNADVVILNSTTKGQAETAFIGMNLSKLISTEDRILIFNIDTFRPNYRFPANLTNADGYLEVFDGEGENWSFAKPKADGSTRVIQTTEKQPISNLCSTGMYYFRDQSTFTKAYHGYYTKEGNKEEYIAPIYNFLIKHDYEIHYDLIKGNEVFFCGTPMEYDQLLHSSFHASFQ